MQTKIRIKKTGKICYCDEQIEKVGQEIVKIGEKEYPRNKYIRHYYVSPDSTEEYNIEDIEIIPQEPYELFGIECGEGWKELLKPIFDYIEEYNKDKSENNKIKPTQIKEKFGSLRAYFNFMTDELKEIVNKAEQESWETCEICGSKEKVGHTQGWITTCCQKCVQKMADNNKRTYHWKYNNDYYKITKEDIIKEVSNNKKCPQN